MMHDMMQMAAICLEAHGPQETAPLRSASWDFSASPAHKPIFASTLDLLDPEQQICCGPAKRQI